MENISPNDTLKDELLSIIEYRKTNAKSHLNAEKIVKKLIVHKDSNFIDRSFPEFEEMDFIQNLKLNRKNIIKFSLAHPEAAYDLLYYLISYKTLSYKDFAGQDKEKIMKLPSLIREVIAHPENIYKMKAQHRIDSRLLYYIPDDNPWEAFEWIATHTPDKFKILTERPTSINPFKKLDIIKRYSAIDDKSQIPEVILAYIENYEKLHNTQIENGKKSSEIKKQKKLEKKPSWIDENGKFIELFKLSDGFPITSPDDYIFIANYYRNSNLSINEFCKKFKIRSVDGFKQMCEIISLTDFDFAEFYKSSLESQKRDYVVEIKNQIEDVALKGVPLNKMLENQKFKRSLHTIIKIGESIVDSETLKIFAENIIAYYYERINSYSSISTDVDEILNRLTNDEIKFLIPSKINNHFKSNQLINIGEEFSKAISPVVKFISPDAKKLVFNRINGLFLTLDAYSLKFDYENYINGNNQFIMPDGSIVPCNQEIVDMAYAFAYSHKLFKSSTTMSRILKAIAEGKIQNQAETQEYKQNLQNSILNKIKECKTLEEYFEKFNTLY